MRFQVVCCSLFLSYQILCFTLKRMVWCAVSASIVSVSSQKSGSYVQQQPSNCNCNYELLWFSKVSMSKSISPRKAQKIRQNLFRVNSHLFKAEVWRSSCLFKFSHLCSYVPDKSPIECCLEANCIRNYSHLQHRFEISERTLDVSCPTNYPRFWGWSYDIHPR